MTMAVNAPSHREIFGLMNFVHLVDSSMAGDAANTAIHMHRMIKENEVRETVNLYPRDGVARFPAIM